MRSCWNIYLIYTEDEAIIIYYLEKIISKDFNEQLKVLGNERHRIYDIVVKKHAHMHGVLKHLNELFLKC